MLTQEQIASLTKMYEDVQVLKDEVTSLRSYKEDSMAAIKSLITDKDKLIEEVKNLKEAKGLVSVPPVTGLFSGSGSTPSTSRFNLSSTPATSNGFMTQPPAAQIGFVAPSQVGGTNGFGFVGNPVGAAGKPTGTTSMPMWNTRPFK
jgi:hypothetical protein